MRKLKEERKNTLGLESNSARSSPYLSRKSCFCSSLADALESAEKKMEWKEWWARRREEVEKLPAAETTRALLWRRRRRRKEEGEESEKGRGWRSECGREAREVEEAMAMSVLTLAHYSLPPRGRRLPRFIFFRRLVFKLNQTSKSNLIIYHLKYLVILYLFIVKMKRDNCNN